MSSTDILANSKNQMNDEEGEEMIQCDCIGSLLFTDNDGRKFYTACTTLNLMVNLGDCVRIVLEDDSAKSTSNCASHGFAQITAIYDLNDEVFIEVRWFMVPEELTSYHQKM